ncbi:glycyl aminopeptidase [Halomicrococcus sp. NG-SE-24]|uniref:glycyl aminopeptidase n=1 Tax=Halomicrococcus sp. NG-SE-24 TaxID=3436928 RepID=UPI003D99BCC7
MTRPGGWVSQPTVSLLVALLVVATAFAPVAAATARTDAAPAARPDSAASLQSQSAASPPSVNVTVERGDDLETVRLHLSFDAPAEARSFWVLDYTGNVVSTEGFVADETEDGDSGYRWDGETASPSMTVETSVDAAAGSGDSEGSEYAATDAWTLVPTPKLAVAWLPADGSEWRYRRPLQRESYPKRVEFVEAGVLGGSFLYVGQYEEYTRRADGQRFRVVVAANATPATKPPEALDALAAASRRLPGESPDDVLAFVLPDPIRRGGFAAAKTDEFWVHEDAELSDPSNLWVHEYVHTRQSFSLETRMQWFREASAGYFAANASMRQGRVERATVARTLRGKAFADATLSKPSTWSSHEVPYYRGPLVLWALDRRIRQATDGDRDLRDVFDRMNRQKGAMSYADFERIVADVAGRSLDAWLERYVTTTERPGVKQLGVAAAEVDGPPGDGRGAPGDRPRLPGAAEYLSSALALWSALALVGLAVGLTLGGRVADAAERFRDRR